MPATRASHRSIFVQVRNLKVETGGRNLEGRSGTRVGSIARDAIQVVGGPMEK